MYFVHVSSILNKTTENQEILPGREAFLRGEARSLVLDIKAFKDGYSVKKESNHPLSDLTPTSRKIIYVKISALIKKTKEGIAIDTIGIKSIYNSLIFFLDMFSEIQEKIPELYAEIDQLKSAFDLWNHSRLEALGFEEMQVLELAKRYQRRMFSLCDNLEKYGEEYDLIFQTREKLFKALLDEMGLKWLQSKREQMKSSLS